MQTLAQTGRCAPQTAGGRHASRTSQQHLAPFSGFRRAGVVDRTERSSAATLQAAVAKRASSRGAKMVTKAMFERFTEKAIKVVMLAQEEARRLGHVSGRNWASHVGPLQPRPASLRLEPAGCCVILDPIPREFERAPRLSPAAELCGHRADSAGPHRRVHRCVRPAGAARGWRAGAVGAPPGRCCLARRFPPLQVEQAAPPVSSPPPPSPLPPSLQASPPRCSSPWA